MYNFKNNFSRFAGEIIFFDNTIFLSIWLNFVWIQYYFMAYYTPKNTLHSVLIKQRHNKCQKYFSYTNATTNEPACQIVPREPKSEPPYQLKIFKGYKNVIIRRDFASFLIYHPVAKAFEEYLHDAVIPDELIYATLSRIEDIKKSNALRIVVSIILQKFYWKAVTQPLCHCVYINHLSQFSLSILNFWRVMVMI